MSGLLDDDLPEPPPDPAPGCSASLPVPGLPRRLPPPYRVLARKYRPTTASTT